MPWTVADVDDVHSGLTDAQKRQWVEVANAALATCLEDGGSQEECEASAIRQANGVVVNRAQDHHQRYTLSVHDYQIRMEEYQGRKHAVVPVVMMVEGVHHGSAGPILHLGDELSKFPSMWNGIPVVVYHPEDEEGHYISANRPELDYQIVGRVFNTRWDDGKLKAEAWLDHEQMQHVSMEAMNYINSGQALEVSVGVFTDEDQVEGTWNGEEYTAVARNHRPDHLALLPGGTGACSWEDGCGVRANEETQKGDPDVKRARESTKDPIITKDNETQVLKELAADGYSVILGNEGFREVMDTIQQKLDAMDTDTKIHYLKEVFDDGTFVYEVRRREEGGSTLYQRAYEMQNNGEIEFTGEPQEVRQKVEYVAMEDGQVTRAVTINTKKEQDMGKTKQTPCCAERVQSLIDSEHTDFVDDDKEWMENLKEAQVQKLEAMEQQAAKAEDGDPKEEDREPEPVTQEQAMQVLKEGSGFKKTEDYLNILPEELREEAEHGLKLHRNQKRALIAKITAHSDKLSAETLEGKSMDELEAIADLIQEPVDYSGMGSGTNGKKGQTEDDILMPTGFGTEKGSDSA